MSFGLTDDGFIAPRAADFLEIVRDEYEAQTGLDIDFDRDTFLGIFSIVVADRLGLLGDISQALFDSFDVNGATGLSLDNLALVVGVTREAPSKSQIPLTVNGTIGTVVPSGAIVEGGGTDGKARWVLLSSVTLTGTPDDVTGEAVEAGPIQAQAGAFAIVSPVIAGWDTVTATAIASVGDARETDPELRLRRQQSLQVSGGSSVNALRGALLALTSVDAAAVFDNDTNVNGVIIDGSTLAAHSVQVIILPSTITEPQKQEIAETIYNQLPAGIATNGTNVVANVTGADGFLKEIRFNFGSDVTVDVDYTVTLDAGFALADVSDPLKALAADLFDTFTLGDTVRVLDMLTLANQVEGIVGATVLLNGFSNDVFATLSTRSTLGLITVT